MTFPIWYLLVPYSAVVFFAALFLFFNIFHLARYGLEAGKTYGLMAGYLISFILVVTASIPLLLAYDWSYEVNPEEILQLNNEASSNYGL